MKRGTIIESNISFPSEDDQDQTHCVNPPPDSEVMLNPVQERGLDIGMN